MTDQQEPTNADPPCETPKSNWIVRCVKEIKRKFEQHCAEKNEESPQDRASRRTANATIWIAFFTAVTIVVAISTYFVLSRQLDELRDEFSYAHRPHFRIRFANIEHTGDKLFIAGKPVRGTIDILNNGQATAEILESYLGVYWSNTGLPALFPYLIEARQESARNKFACDTHGQHGVICEIPPGTAHENRNFQSRTSLPDGETADNIEAGTANWHIYLLGWISYQGIGDRYTRHFDFAEVYEPQRRRFFPVHDDPDYAYDPDAK